MKLKKRDGWMIAGGFALGTLGLKALSSSAAKKCYVQGVAKGLQAKAQVDDIVAEASYINESAKIEQSAVDGE